MGSVMNSGASQSPFLLNFKDSVHPRKACLYVCINWSLAQTKQQFTLSLFLSSTSMRDSKARSKTGFQFNVQKWPALESSGASLTYSLT